MERVCLLEYALRLGCVAGQVRFFLKFYSLGQSCKQIALMTVDNELDGDYDCGCRMYVCGSQVDGRIMDGGDLDGERSVGTGAPTSVSYYLQRRCMSVSCMSALFCSYII